MENKSIKDIIKELNNENEPIKEEEQTITEISSGDLSIKEKEIREKYKKMINEVKDDFKKFVFVIHNYLNMEKPTKLQYSICDVIQADEDRTIIEAFRGCGKSHITALYVLWRLMKNPYLRILVVSASKARAYNFTAFIQRLIKQVKFLSFLKPHTGQKFSKDSFDVGPAKNSANQDNSVTSTGISSQLAGKRADIIIGDDVEGTNNSQTELKRERLLKTCEEFESIIVPEGKPKIIFLGTPQTESSIYNKLSKRNYKLHIWPALIPEDKEKYNGGLSSYVMKLKYGIGEPTDPERFSKDYLRKKLESSSRSGFALQFMLDVTLSDIDKYPLKLKDLIVFNTPITKAPIDILYSNSKEFNFPNYGLDNDRLYQPSFVDEQYKEFEDIVMAIDPAGAGKDETAYTIIGLCNGKLYILDVGAYRKPGASDEVLDKLVEKCIEYNVKNIIVETNFGAYKEILTGHIRRNGIKAEVHGIFNTRQKEKRIIDTLSPLFFKHHIIITEKVLIKEQQFLENNYEKIENIDNNKENEHFFYNNSNIELEYNEEELYQFSLLYQITRITEDRQSLIHDDRIDSLALGCFYFKDRLDRNIELAKQQHIKRQKEKQVKEFRDSYFKKLGLSGNNGNIIGNIRGKDNILSGIRK